MKTFSGHNRISTQALTSTAKAVAANTFDIPPRSIRADWTDDAGLLALSLALPVAIPALDRVNRDPGVVDGFGGSVWDRAGIAKSLILERVIQLTGSRLSRVDIRFTGIVVTGGGRVS
ncbi:hypothetical protein [Arthrobacter roseus]|uniref:hypothetical protein n=1 Tax=Arthrobacter roseus TaxID=136274 RepID=UPI0019662B52|nr:hypothetical protein [Arthrobacter roseus]MBM7847363.1 hypothetical protein [Arthrobacter roseus]